MVVRKIKRQGELKQSERRTAVTNTVGRLTLKEMHRIFLRYKRSEGLATRTIEGYEDTFGYLIDYLGGDLTKREMTEDVFIGYKDYIVNEPSDNTYNARYDGKGWRIVCS